MEKINVITAEEMDAMVNRMRKAGRELPTRMSLSNMVYDLMVGLQSIGKTDLASQLGNLYIGLESIPTSDVVKQGTFR